MSTAFEKFSLKDKNAVVTGGAGLLGQQHIRALLEAGANVAVTDVSLDNARSVASTFELEFGRGRVVGLQMDVANRDSIQKARELLQFEWGSVNILVNNAAIDPKVSKDNSGVEFSRFENFPLQQWDFQISVGLTGAFLCAQEFGPPMAAQSKGVILNISSDLSVIAPDQRLYRKNGLPEDAQPVKPVTYSVIKTALLGLTRYLAAYWADKGVRVNALSPGGVFNNQPDQFVAKLSDLIPMKRMAHADEYRSAVQFLCSDASSYLTGQNIIMDGGRSII